MKYLILSIFLLFGLQELEARKYIGYIVDIEGDTINCHIVFNDLAKYKVGDELLSPSKIRIEVDNKKLTIVPELILSYAIKNGDKWETYWSVNTTRQEYMFMKLEIKGTMNYYYAKTFDSETKEYAEHTLLHQYKSNKKLYVVHGMKGNRAKLIRFTSDCPFIQEKIKDKELRPELLEDLKRVIHQYNARCR